MVINEEIKVIAKRWSWHWPHHLSWNHKGGKVGVMVVFINRHGGKHGCTNLINIFFEYSLKIYEYFKDMFGYFLIK